MTKEEILPVEQIDRGAAWPFRPFWMTDTVATCRAWNAGEHDREGIVQAFAKHRLAGSQSVEPTEAMVDRAAQHLRETQQAGKKLTPWDRTPKATKRKWVELASGTLRAALTTPHQETTDGSQSSALDRVREALKRRSVPTMDATWSAAFNAALDMVERALTDNPEQQQG